MTKREAAAAESISSKTGQKTITIPKGSGLGDLPSIIEQKEEMIMSKEFRFFTLKEDLLEILSDIEDIKYVKSEIYNKEEYITYKSITEFEDLGINRSGDHNSPIYLVLYSEDPIISEGRKQIDTGEIKYFLGQSHKRNRDSIAFWPGGLYEENFLIHGHVSTISDDKKSEELYKIFKKAFSKKCKKIKNWYFGKEALLIAKDVRLITIDVNQNQLYDFKIDTN